MDLYWNSLFLVLLCYFILNSVSRYQYNGLVTIIALQCINKFARAKEKPLTITTKRKKHSNFLNGIIFQSSGSSLLIFLHNDDDEENINYII